MLSELFVSLTTFVLSLISQFGYFGIFVGMAIESSFFPFPSEVVLIPAGILVSQGQMSILPIIFASILGSFVGAAFNFVLALILGRFLVETIISKYGKFIFLKNSDLKKADKYFENYGEITTFFGRLIPVVRQLISLPAGFSKMNFLKFSLYTCLGAGIWSLILVSTGYFFGNNLEWINANFSLLSIIFGALCLIVFSIYLLNKQKKSNY